MSEEKKTELDVLGSEDTTANLPTSVKEQLAALREEAEDSVGALPSNKITTKGKVFTLPGEQKGHPGPLSVIILDYVHMNSYFKGAYDPNNPQRPVCFAIDRVLKKKDGTPVSKPSTNAPEPQGEYCETCPKFQWSSGPNGKGKACKQQRRLIVCAPDAKSVDDVRTIYVSPAAQKNFDAYLNKVLAAGFSTPLQLITDISFDPNQAYPLLTFSVAETHGRVGEMLAIREAAQAILLKEPEVEAKAA